MNSDVSAIATIGKWSSLSAAFFTAISAVAIYPWYFDFDSNGSVNYFCWLFVASSYLITTICNKYVVSLQKNILDSFYAELAVTFAMLYAVYECAIYYREWIDCAVNTCFISDAIHTNLILLSCSSLVQFN